MTIQEQVYVGGPMTGMPRLNFDAFDSLAHWLRRNRKWHVHSPAEHDRETWPTMESWPGFDEGRPEHDSYSLESCLSWDLARVAESQHLVLLPGWEQSTGARHERHVAELTGSSIWLAKEMYEAKAPWLLELDVSREGSLQPTPTPVAASASSLHYMPDPYVRVSGSIDEQPLKRTFNTGATRDLADHKPDYDGFLSVTAFRAYGRYMLAHRKMADGSLRDSDNWQKGIPLDAYMKSLFRHTVDVWDLHRQGDTLLDYDGETPVTLKEALCGVIFNAFGYLHEVTKNG